MVIIDRIKELAKERGIKQKYICSKFGVAESYLSDVANGKTAISEARIKIAANILNTTPAYLKGETDIKIPPQNKGGSDLKKTAINIITDMDEDNLKELIRFADFLKYKHTQ